MMANDSSLVQNATVKNDENVDKFPYRILNDLSKKLKVAEATIASLLAECESNRSNPKLLGDVGILAVKTVPYEALEDAKDDEIKYLKRRISELTYANNRYHLTISNCTFCVSDDANTSDASTVTETSIRASTPVSCSSPSSHPDPPSSVSTIPALMPGCVKVEEADTVVKRKDKTFINRMVKALVKLETKYLTPVHKRKKRLFERRKKCSIVPHEFSSIYYNLATPELEVQPELNPPQVNWSNVRFQPALPNPVECPLYSCSLNPKTYENSRDMPWSAPFYSKNPFGTKLGYRTTEGVIDVPTVPVGGYVFCTEVRQWILYASSSASGGKGPRRGKGDYPPFRKKG